MSTRLNMFMLILFTGICSFIVQFNCSKDNSANPDPVTHEDFQSNCLDVLFSTSTEPDSMYLSVDGNNLHVYHINAYYQCCLEYAVSYDINDFDITATEADTGSPCLCDCYFNLESVLYDLKNGTYTVTLIGIEGDTVGVDSATIEN